MKNLIIFTIDCNYLQPLIVALQSFISFHDMNKYKIAVLHSNLTNDQEQLLYKYSHANEVEIEIKRIDDIFINFKVDYHFNSVIFYRLLIPSVFSEYEKVLYIDSDIIFLDNIDKVFEIDLGGNILAAIPKTFIGVPQHLAKAINRYFASGILLININLYNQHKILNNILQYLKCGEYQMPDQDALNITVKNWIALDLRYGLETCFLDSDDPILKEAKKNPAIIQFSGSSKPWHYLNRHPYKELYWHYLKKTPYKNYIPDDYTLLNIIKKQIPNPIKQFIKKAVNR